MGNDYRNESRRRPSSDKWGTPGTQFPTPNPYDVVITEEADTRAQSFEPVLYGTPHPTVAEARLCFQSPIKGNATDKSPIRVYANPRLAQEPYNLVNGDDEVNDANFPTYVRSYLLPRGYTQGARNAPLRALIGLKLTAGGSGYTPAANSGKLALSFSGGGGSGAAGYAEIVNGAVVAVVLTNSGDGYTSLPTVSVAGGTGASITAQLQSDTAYLTDETEQPAEDPYGGYFVRVTRTYETLPGPALVTQRYDEVSDAMITITRTKKFLATITEGVELSGSTVIITESDPINESIGWEIKTTQPQPDAHDDDTAIILSNESQPFKFPGTLDVAVWLANSGAIGSAPPFIKRVPHVKKAYWVISSTAPTFAPNGLIEYSEQKGLLGSDLSETVYNATSFDGHSFPGSSPNYTTYNNTWVGGDPRVVLGGVYRESKYRWRVEKVYVQFEKLREAS